MMANVGITIIIMNVDKFSLLKMHCYSTVNVCALRLCDTNLLCFSVFGICRSSSFTEIVTVWTCANAKNVSERVPITVSQTFIKGTNLEEKLQTANTYLLDDMRKGKKMRENASTRQRVCVKALIEPFSFIYGTNKAASEESLKMKCVTRGVLLLLMMLFHRGHIEEDSCFRQSGQRDEMTVDSKGASAYSILSEL